MVYHRILLLAVVSIFTFSRVSAGDDCPAIVNTALETAAAACDSIGRNQVCYGHVNMDVTAQDAAPVFTFQQVGDITDITHIRTLQLSALDTVNDLWGIALMRLQANLPDTLPGQNVTVVLFGNVQFEVASAQAFYFHGALNDSPCSEAPESGMLIQAPRGMGMVTLEINGAQVSLGSTAYLQSDSSKLRLTLLAGQGDVIANQTETFIPTGTFSEIPLDNSGQAPSGSPSAAQAYSPDTVGTLPLKLLPEPVPSAGIVRPYLVNSCTGLQDGGSTIRAGETVRFAVGCCGAPTLEEQQQRESQIGAPSLTLDGSALNLYSTGIFLAEEGWYTDDGRYDWVAVPGAHSISGGWGSNLDTCSFEVAGS